VAKTLTGESLGTFFEPNPAVQIARK
jgi:hypothetical protein